MPNNQNKLTPGKSDFNPSERHNARRYALQAMYQWHIADTTADELEIEFLTYHIDKKIDLDYFKTLLHGVLDDREAIDAEMQPYLGRPIQEIDPIELAVLRVATYEILRRNDIPYRVIINEALELTKEFGSIEGHKFVNGVLDRVAKKNREK